MGEKERRPVSEEKTVSASYVINFYNDFQSLTHYYSVYVNILVEIQARYGAERAGQHMSDEERSTLLNASQNIRHFMNKTYFSYVGISANAPGNAKRVREEDKGQIEQVREKINGQLIVEARSVEEYILGLNRFIAGGIMKSLLLDSEEIVKGIYAED